MRPLVIGALALVGCWRGGGGGGGKAEPPAPKEREVAVADTEPVVGDSTKSEHQLAREQAIEQARAAGILGTAAQAQPPGPPPGPLDKESIRRAIRTHIKPISLCYEQRLTEDAKLQGTTQVLFTIGADGSVVSATASGFDPAVDTCVADAVKAIRFPVPDGGGTMQVRYPFIFHPAS